MDRPVLYVHAGSHKTGTTAIQRALAASAAELREQGVCWPRLGSSPHHHRLVQAMYAGGRLARWRSRLMVRRIVRQSRGCRTTVLSSEQLYRVGFAIPGIDPSGDGATGRNRSEVLAALRESFGDLFDIRVVLYLRRVDEFAESFFKEILFRKELPTLPTFESFIEQQSVLFDYDARVAEFETQLGPVHAYDYDAARRKGLLVHFCSSIGIRAPEVPATAAPVRPSPSDAAARFVLQLGQARELSRADRLKLLDFALSSAWPEPAGVRYSLWASRHAHANFVAAYGAPRHGPAASLPAPHDRVYGPMEPGQFERCRQSYESWLVGNR